MPAWLTPVLSWMGTRAVNFVVYALIALALWGVYFKVFLKDTSKTTTTQKADKITNYTPSVQPHFGCATINYYGNEIK